ncbi:hypothetical protein IEQ_05126 [Bacillus cereus BAG6X1-2]|nr:hypothetical protein IEQ_05126 [Bacillus cereus BAG6X1-2]
MLNIEKTVHYYNYAQRYLMMPKAVDEYLTIHDVSLGACKLYMHLRDRYRLSLKSVSEGNDKYEDELGVFCIYPIEDLVEIMGKNEKTVRRWYNELKECGLIHYRQVKKESGQANRFYIKEEQLVDSELIALYTSEEYKPVVHYDQIGADKNVQSVSGQKCPPINNNYLINNIKTYTGVLEFVNTCRHDFVHLKTMDEQELQGYAKKWYETYNPKKGANIQTWIRACMDDLNEGIEDPSYISDKFTERFYENLEKEKEQKTAIMESVGEANNNNLFLKTLINGANKGDKHAMARMKVYQKEGRVYCDEKEVWKEVRNTSDARSKELLLPF